ncbi:hypothetical protein SpCBS45565_g00298 [Spizellomyces sp. 'palustris']|nr:hypothetical protein SpCBS45565_g00298 [Spizellomyces sp. 'palustris']
MTLHRATSLTSTDQEVNEGMAELELQKLARQYRIMEGDRKAYSEESRLLITKQRATIEKLKRENQYLVDELALLEQRTDEKNLVGREKKVEALAEQADAYNRKIRALLNTMSSLDATTTALSRDIDTQRSHLGGVNAAYENSESITKQIKVLENRLDKALVKFNKSLAVNKTMRGVIDNLRRERMVFDGIYRKFEKEVGEQKKLMAEVIEASNSAYEARDEAQARMIALKEKSEKEHQAYIQEIKELDRSLEQDKRLKDFMATKVADRHVLEDGDLKKEGKKKDKTVLKPRFGSQDTLTDSLESYEKSFSQIQSKTGVSSIKDLVKRMKTVEDENFSLFNYVNEVNNDMEQLAEEIIEIQKRMDALRVGNVVEEERMEGVLKGLETLLATTTKQHTQYETHYTEMLATLSDLTHALQPLSHLCPITEDIITTLGHIEQKTNELLTLYYAVFPKKTGSAAPSLEEGGSVPGSATERSTVVVVGGLLGHGPNAPVGNITIVPPSTGDDHDDDLISEEDDRPLTREELEKRTLRGLSKRDKHHGTVKTAGSKHKRKGGAAKKSASVVVE